MSRPRLITLDWTIEDDGGDTRPPLYGDFRVTVKVLSYTPATSGRIGYADDCDPPEPAELEYEVVEANQIGEGSPSDPDLRSANEWQATAYLDTNEAFYEALIAEIEAED